MAQGIFDLRTRLLRLFSPRLAALERLPTQEVTWIRSIRHVRNIPFNGDPKRLEIVDALLDAVPRNLGIETGTWVGNTTQWLVRKLPSVVAIELDPGLLGVVTLRLGQERNLILQQGSSAELMGPLLAQHADTKTFCYLDAHDRGDKPPLDEELKAVVSHPDCVVLIDDFEIPGTTFGFGTYGGVALNVAYLRRSVPTSVKVFGPSYPCDGKTRGWALFGTGAACSQVEAFAARMSLAALG